MLDLVSLPDNQKQGYAIRSVDRAGYSSEYSHILFDKPGSIGKPPNPVVENISPDGTEVTLRIPEYDKNIVQGIRVYQNGEYMGTFITDTAILENNSVKHLEYTFRYELADSVVSTRSELTVIKIPN